MDAVRVRAVAEQVDPVHQHVFAVIDDAHPHGGVHHGDPLDDYVLEIFKMNGAVSALREIVV